MTAVEASAAFRHDPRKSVMSRSASRPVAWSVEPAVRAHRRLTYLTRGGVTVPVPVCSTAVLTERGVVVGTYDGWIRCYTPDLEKLCWEHRLDGAIYSSLVVDRPRGTILAATVTGTVSCFDTNGAKVWSRGVGAPVYATPTVLGEPSLLVLAAFGSRGLAIDLASGRVEFDRGLPPPWHSALNRTTVRDPYASPVATPGGDIVFGCAEHLVCCSPDGSTRWIYDTGSAVRASPVVVQRTDEVVACSVDGGCRFVRAADGSPVAEVHLGGKITGSAAVAGNILAVGIQDGAMFGLDVTSHEVVWSHRSGAPRDHTSLTVLPNGDFVATSARGNVEARRQRDGGFLWETSQLLGLADHHPELDTTPLATPDGSLYAGSYSGMFYHFVFRGVNGDER